MLKDQLFIAAITLLRKSFGISNAHAIPSLCDLRGADLDPLSQSKVSVHQDKINYLLNEYNDILLIANSKDIQRSS